MAPDDPKKKRKASLAATEDSEDETFGAILDGVLSESEDSEVELEGGSSSDDDEDLNGEQDDDDESENSDDADDALHSDDIPSDDDQDTETKPPVEQNGEKVRPQLGEDAEDTAANYRVTIDANGGIRYEYDEIDAVYDSDDTDAQEPANTIGNIPLSFYDAYPHVGYDINGKKIMRPARGEALDALLDSIEIPKGWTGLTDPSTGKPLNLTQEELELLRRIQQDEIPEEGFNPYPDTVEYFTSIEETMPLSAAPEPKRRFVPSKHEAKRVMKLVRAIREGRIQPYKPPEEREREEEEKEEVHYDIWQDEQPREPHIMHIPAPKLAYPGYDLSYNPPPEYLPTDAEKQAWQDTDPEEREKEYLPQQHDSLRKVPGYDMFVKERFERCLDLYLAPRVRKNRLQVDPNSLLPKLPPAEDLRPFPTVCQTIFRGHEGWVRSLAIDPTGCWLASGGNDGTVRVWDLLTGRQLWSVKLSSDDSVSMVRWRPTKETFILSAAAAEDLFLMIPPIGDPELEIASRKVLDAGFGHAAKNDTSTNKEFNKRPAATWARPGSRLEEQGVAVKVTMRAPIKHICWHRKGDHLSTVSPSGSNQSVAIHTLSKHLSQTPFRKIKNRPIAALFHPQRPMFFLATQQMIRCYDLQQMQLSKTIQPGARMISSFDVHPTGEHLVVGSYDRRLMWHDLDLSSRPYKTMRFHQKAIRSVQYHPSLPLYADASDDGSLQVFHGRVVQDLLETPTIVPLKMLKGHKVVDQVGVLELCWHPRKPWCVSAGADGVCRLWS